MIRYSLDAKNGPICVVLGWLMVVLGGCMLGHGLSAWWLKEAAFGAFFLSACISIVLGVLNIAFFARRGVVGFSAYQSFVLTVAAWCLVACLAGLPFYFSNMCPKMIDALFEAVSALTTTGISVVSEAAYFCASLKFWSVFLQWFGGFGLIMTAVIFLPILRLGGNQLMHVESSDQSEKIAPRASTMAACLCGVYGFLTLLIAVCLNTIGSLPLWDSVTYAMATISTGGIAMSQYGVLTLGWPTKMILSLGMVLGATTLVLFVNVFRGNWRSLIDDDQVRGMVNVLLFTLAGVVLWHWEKPLIDSVLMTVSVLSGAGFAGPLSFDFGGFFWLATLIGGCSGSASGGIKIFRLQIMYRVAKNNLLRCLYPSGFYPTLYNKHSLDAAAIEGVMAAVFFYLAGLLVSVTALTLCGYAVVDAVTLASGALTSSGLALGTWADHTQSFSCATKWVVMLTMLCGRLELVTVLGLFFGLLRR